MLNSIISSALYSVLLGIHNVTISANQTLSNLESKLSRGPELEAWDHFVLQPDLPWQFLKIFGFDRITNGLQAQNQRYLMGYTWAAFAHYNIKLPENPVIYEAGCGSGMFVASWEWARHILRVDKKATLVLLDKDPEKIALVNDLVPRLGKLLNVNACLVAPPVDFNKLNRAFIEDATIPPADHINCNSVYHWVPPEDRLTVLKNFYSVLNPEGTVSLSVSAPGTSKLFYKAYHSLLRKHNGEWLKGVINTDNVIGNMRNNELNYLALQAGFNVLSCWEGGQEVYYQDEKEYSNAVRKYGFERFMLPFRKYMESINLGENVISGKLNELWNELEVGFSKIVKKHNALDEFGRYHYTQYNTFQNLRKSSLTPCL